MTKITVSTTVNAPLEKVWECWTTPEHIEKWNAASEDWECRDAKNDLWKKGSFSCVMAAKDGSASFEFGGTYSEVIKYKLIAYEMEDARIVQVSFEEQDNGVKVTELFDAETDNSEELQRQGWQSILNNFKEYVERS